MRQNRGEVSGETSAADLKFLQHLPRPRRRNFKSKSGTGIISLLVPFLFSKFVLEIAARYHELRKQGTSEHHHLRHQELRHDEEGAGLARHAWGGLRVSRLQGGRDRPQTARGLGEERRLGDA